MRILLTNDDGIDAEGISRLAEGLKRDYEITICAPSAQRSASSHAVTYFFKDHTYQEKGKNIFAIDGTPADCVYFGIHAFMKEKPDLLISGINHGQNLSSDVIYSGTVGAAVEGMMLGVPSVAVSLCSYTSSDFSDCVKAVQKLIPYFMRDPDNTGYVLNVNVPAIKDIKGFKVTHLEASLQYVNKVTAVKNEANCGRIHTERIGVIPVQKERDANGDLTAVQNGYISLTPLCNNITDNRRIKQMQKYEYLLW